MKLKVVFLAACGLGVALLTACNGDKSAMAVATPTAQSLDTMQLLAMAQQTSEVSEPFTVVGGALKFTDTSETTSPITVNVM